MEKLVYVLWKKEAATPASFGESVLVHLADRFLQLGTPRLAINLVDEHVTPALGARITHLSPPPSGTVSFWLDVADDREGYEEALAECTDRRAGYLVTESVPLHNTTHAAKPGERVPGINMVALLERPQWMDWEAWIHHWHGHHRKVALETQCTYQYVRNVVVRRFAADAPDWAGIVEEGFPAEAVTDPMLWYRAEGSQRKLKENLGRMIESCKAFLELDRVESHPMSEYRILDGCFASREAP